MLHLRLPACGWNGRFIFLKHMTYIISVMQSELSFYFQKKMSKVALTAQRIALVQNQSTLRFHLVDDL